MAVYEYKALDGRGKEVDGIVDADSAKFARSKLRRQGVFPTDVWLQQAGGATRGSGLSREIELCRRNRSGQSGICRTIGMSCSSSLPRVDAPICAECK